MIALLLVVLFAGSAWSSPSLLTDPSGTIYRTGIDKNKALLSRSIDQGYTFGKPRIIFAASEEIKSLNLKTDSPSTYFIALETSRESFIAASHNTGSSFLKLFSLPKTGAHPSLSSSDNHVFAVWEDKNKADSFTKENRVAFSDSVDAGQNWSEPNMFQITGESLSWPQIFTDNNANSYLAFISKNSNTRINRVCFSPVSSFEPKVLYENYDEIENLAFIPNPWGITLLWQKAYLGRKENFLLVSLDQGKHFNSFQLPFLEGDPQSIINYGGRWFYPGNEPNSSIKEISFPPPPTPELIFPKNFSVINAVSPEVRFKTSNPDQSLYRIELSWENGFPLEKTWVFHTTSVDGKSEINYKFPIDLLEGKYFLRLSSFNGLNTSPLSKVREFSIDRTPPNLSFGTEESTETNEAVVNGMASEPCWISFANSIASTESDGKFSIKLILQPGKNTISVIATDEAGNTAIIIKTIIFNPPKTDIILFKPGEKDWNKPASTIFLSFLVTNPLLDIADESEANVTINGVLLDDILTYDKKTAEITGFINLPGYLQDGKLPSEIKIKDLAGILHEKKFKLNIDQSPPIVNYSSQSQVFSNNPFLLTLPLLDAGAGVDPLGTIVAISGISCEVQTSGEAQNIYLKPYFPVAEGTYPAEVLPRDTIGNTGKVSKFNLVVDTSPPIFSLFNSSEAETGQNHWLIEGKATDPNLSEIKIYDNAIMIDSFLLSTPNFSRKIPLIPNKNLIRVVAFDQAGNFTATDMQIQANILSTATLVTSFSNGPNPFSPKNDGEMLFAFKFASDPSDLQLYIFDISGTLIWEKDYSGINSGSVSWNGSDQFGNKVMNGVYPYALAVSNGGSKEIRHGKIIVLQ